MLLAVCQELGMEHEIVSRGIASMFAGGIGNTGSVCGAVIGAAMAIGLKTGRKDTIEEGRRALTLAAELRRRFEAETGTISCRELTGVDLSAPDGLEAYMRSDAPMMVCFPAVSTAYRIAVDLLNEAS